VRTNVRRVGQVAWVGSYARVAPRRALAMDTSCVGARRMRVPGRLAVRGSRTAVGSSELQSRPARRSRTGVPLPSTRDI
jgi:hypothetical protein